MSLGNDLATIRMERNFSLEDIFETTKIPVHTLKSIENDTLFETSTENKTYLRSFIRSYAKALKISDDHILAALKANEAGDYDHALLKLVHPDTTIEQQTDDKGKKSEPDSSEITDLETPSTENEIKVNKPPTAQQEQPKKSVEKPTVSTVNWADMSKKVYASPTNSKIGLLLIIFLLIGSLGAVGFFYGENIISLISSGESVEDPNNTQTDPLVTTDSSLIANDEGINEDSTLAPPVITMPETLTVALYAAYDKLEPVRVTSDLNNRTNPFWMNQGEAYYFDFRDSLVVRGQYARFLLMFNGKVISNPRQNYFDPALNSIVITRNVLSGPEFNKNDLNIFPENLGVEAPDSIIYRIDF